MFLDEIQADTLESIANLFASHFESTYNIANNNNNNNSLFSLHLQNLIDIGNIHIIAEDILSKLIMLSSSVNPGSDGLPLLFIKKICRKCMYSASNLI